jgi:tetratricopeptide (TPR) repeat protein
MQSIPRTRSTRLSALALSLSLIGACSIVPLTVDTKATAPVLDGYGDATLVPSQGNETARRLFAQGMSQAYAFNRPEAIRAFKAALAQDPACGMCAWGAAAMMGPNINNSSRGDLTEAIRYADYAVRHSAGASARDRDLVAALALRYGHKSASTVAMTYAAICRAPETGPRADPLDIAYAAQMRELAARYPSDPDVLIFYTEAEMVATRGGWWDETSGKPKGRIGEVANMVEAALAKQPNHVGLNHYMIHAVDAVPVASRAVAAADRLGTLAPKSPHLLHMPSHTYANVGRYADATRVNQLAVAADLAFFADLKKQGYKVSMDWREHNTHFQWYGALMQGRAGDAMESARATAALAKGDSVWADYMRSVPVLTMLNLQRWDELAAQPLAPADKGVHAVISQMGRGIAQARTGKRDEARATLAALKPKVAALAASHAGEGRFAEMIRGIAASSEAQLGAEIALADGRIDDALKLQARAAEAGAAADRTEPPMLAGGPRIRLGALQMRSKRYVEAEQTYRASLAQHPANGWALNGLEKALSAQGKTAEAQRAVRDLAVSWASADSQVRTIQ